MGKLISGQNMPDFSYDTPFAKGKTLAQTAQSVKGKTALVFLRYYGCTLCQYDIHLFAEHYAEITRGAGQLLVVLQSAPEVIAGQLKPGQLPFDIICDPQQKLYREFEIGAAASMIRLAGFKTIGKMAAAAKAGFKHGAYEGEELQLPAVFVLTPDMKLTYVHYGKHASDVPNANELAKLLA